METELFNMAIGESIELTEISHSGAYQMNWHITRVPNGWIFIEENANITRSPVSIFVPLTTYSSPNI